MRNPVGTNWIGPGGHVIHYPIRRGLMNFTSVVENRDWKPPTSVGGTRIALHAGKAWDQSGALSLIQRGHRLATSFATRQGILGTVRLVGVVEERRGRLELVAGDWGEVTRERCALWFVGRYGWLVDERRVLEVPIPAKGFQKLWTVPDELVARLA